MQSFFLRYGLRSSIIAFTTLALIYSVVLFHNATYIGYTGIKEGTLWGLSFFSNTFGIFFLAFGLVTVVLITTHLYTVIDHYQTKRPQPRIRTWGAILLIGNLLSCCTLLENFSSGVKRIDATHDQADTYMLAFKSNFEYGQAYYLFHCDRFEWTCTKVHEFTDIVTSPHETTLSFDQQTRTLLVRSQAEILGQYTIPPAR